MFCGYMYLLTYLFICLFNIYLFMFAFSRQKTVSGSKLSRHSARRSAVRESKSGGIRRKSTDQF